MAKHKGPRKYAPEQKCHNKHCKHIFWLHDKNGCRAKGCYCTVSNPTLKNIKSIAAARRARLKLVLQKTM